MRHLYGCPHCARHVRSEEPRCPFCGVQLDPSRAPIRRVPSERLSRAAQVAFTVTLGAHVVSCATTRESRPSDGQPAAPAPPASPAHSPSPSSIRASTPDAGAPRPISLVAIYGSSSLVIFDKICFLSGSVMIPSEARATLRAVAETLLRHQLHVLVRGRGGSSEGAGRENLARRRAAAVLVALVQMGVPRDRLDAEGESLSHPWGPDDEPIRSHVDRCVTFKIVPHERGRIRG